MIDQRLQDSNELRRLRQHLHKAENNRCVMLHIHYT